MPSEGMRLDRTQTTTGERRKPGKKGRDDMGRAKRPTEPLSLGKGKESGKN